MKFKHVHFIINPASGKQEPILSYINKVFDNSGIAWDVSITKRNVSARDIAGTLIGKTDLVAVYGGDGCVTEVASVLHGSNFPIAIIPGGTANVMAKELGISTDTTEALTLLVEENPRIISVDMGLVNEIPFLLRVNLGIMADMVTGADRSLKDSIDQLAYGVSTVKTLAEAKSIDYELDIDGRKISASGVTLTVTNSGNIGIGDFALQPGISITDGLLDVILMKESSLTSILKVAGSALLQQETNALQHWKAEKVIIKMAEKQSFICDDTEHFAKELHLEVVPGSIQMLVPAKTQ